MFFDQYPRFYQTSRVGSERERLNLRHKVLIEANASVFAGKRVLDLGSHDGRWSFAVLRAGAAYVLGIEGCESLVDAAHANMTHYGVACSDYAFQVGDFHDVLHGLEPFDVVCCFGVLYHTPHHVQLCVDMARLARRHLVIDTRVTQSDLPVVQYNLQPVMSYENDVGYPYHSRNVALIGDPSRAMIAMTLGHLGFKTRCLDWHAQGVEDWQAVEDYERGDRVSLLAARVG